MASEVTRTTRDHEMWEEWVLNGSSQAEIGRSRGLSQAQVSKRLAVVRESLAAEQRDEVVARRVAQINRAVGANMRAVLRGDKDATANLVRLLDRESRYLGLDQPTKSEAVVHTNVVPAELLEQVRAAAELSDDV